MAQHRHGAGRDDLGADNATHEGRLAAAGRAKQTGDGAPRDPDRHIVECRAFAPYDT